MGSSMKFPVPLASAVLISVLGGIVIISSTTSAAAEDKCFANLPCGCFVVKYVVIPQDQTVAIGRKLGASVKRLSNTDLMVHGKRIQVNILDADTDADAAKLYAAISALKSHPAFCLRIEKKVIEYVAWRRNEPSPRRRLQEPSP